MGARTPAPDRLARLLEWGLLAFVVLAPFPFGAVRAQGRLAIELGALLLLLIWVVRACVRPTALPSRWALGGALGLLLLTAIQAAPIGGALVDGLSPRSLAIRADSRPPQEPLRAEERLLGVELDRFDETATLTVDPGATASALRTGTMFTALFLVATTVAATCGVRKLAVALLVSAGFQALYGLLVLASDDPHIWHQPKLYYLDSATGTFVNKNHFASLLAMGLACGLALILDNARRSQGPRQLHRLLALFRGDQSRNLLLGLLLVLGLAGLLASLSRAGIAVGLAALLLTLLAAAPFQRWRVRLVSTVLVVSIAAIPLLQLGSERLTERYSTSATDFTVHGGRATVWRDTLSMAADMPLVGSGFGTFAAVYPVFRSPEVRLFYSHAHNDLIQVVAEGGLVGLLLLLLILVPVVGTALRSLTGAKGTLGVGFAAALMAILLHSFVDFNFHIPSNAAIAAILAGVVQGLPWNSPGSD